jgi:hypothetical protein
MQRKQFSPDGPIPASAVPGSPQKLSAIMKEMAHRLLLRPNAVPSGEAAHVALFLANVAWNETVGLDHDRDGSRAVWGELETSNPHLWSEFKSRDIEAMIDELVVYKNTHYPDDRRRILTCGIPAGGVRVEWISPAADGADTKWEMRLFGMVRTGMHEEAIEFLQETKGLSRSEASDHIARMGDCLQIN